MSQESFFVVRNIESGRYLNTESVLMITPPDDLRAAEWFDWVDEANEACLLANLDFKTEHWYVYRVTFNQETAS